MFFIPAVESIILLILCIWLLLGYRDKKRTPCSMQMATLFGWFLSFSLIVFIPLDVYLSHKQEIHAK